MAPVVVPDATTAVMVVALTTVKDAAAVPLNVTALALVKFVPVSVTCVVTPPRSGVNEVIVGAGMKVNVAALVAVPPAVVTVIFPVVVPVATIAVICVALTTLKEAASVPLNFTAVASVKFVPLIVTWVFAPALLGVNEVMVGGNTTVNGVALTADPPGVTMVIGPGPVLVPAATVAVIVVAFTTV